MYYLIYKIFIYIKQYNITFLFIDFNFPNYENNFFKIILRYDRHFIVFFNNQYNFLDTYLNIKIKFYFY